ncbi:hypothetical protein RB195_001483 [Necator americanus]|uniref:Uncharacterized protein n=1 Tax=Necator americanus TaxID=51031 RepID=A0ABR1DHG0_NECAM
MASEREVVSPAAKKPRKRMDVKSEDVCKNVGGQVHKNSTVAKGKNVLQYSTPPMVTVTVAVGEATIPIRRYHLKILLNRQAPSVPEVEHVQRPTYAVNREPPAKFWSVSKDGKWRIWWGRRN